jgi:hypothetical protein
MARFNRRRLLWGFCLFCLGGVAGHFATRWVGTRLAARFWSSPAILRQVQELAELVTIQFVIEKVESLEIPSQNLVGQFLGSENRVLLLAHGNVKAGIDLKQLKASDLRRDGKTLRLRLPSPRITDAYLDENLTRVIDRKTGLLAPPDKDLEQSLRKVAVEDIRRAAREGGILREAEVQARTRLGALLLQIGFEKVQFQLEDDFIGAPAATVDR